MQENHSPLLSEDKVALTGQVGTAVVLSIVGISGALISSFGLFTPIRQRNPENTPK